MESAQNKAIYSLTEKAEITVSGNGSVRAGGTGGIAIYCIGDEAKVTINVGTVSATEGFAIQTTGEKARITVAGGEVSATTGAAIGALGDESSVQVDDGTVSASVGAAIGVNAAMSTVIVNGGNVSAATGIAIAINGANDAVKINGGTVNATNMAAIAVAGAGSTVEAGGGFVFAYGQDVTGEGNVINMVNGGSPTIGGSAVAVAWDKPTSGTLTYSEGSTTDLTVAPASATATWGKSGSQNGIKYGSSGFFPISGVTINDAAATAFTVTFNSNSGSAVANQSVNSGGTATKPAPDPTREGYTFGGWYSDAALTTEYVFTTPVTANITLYAKWNAAGTATPAITGPATMTLVEGYAATSTDAYTITGAPAPTVTKTGNAAIVWNDSAKKLEISAGLAKGTYPVVLKAENSAGAVEFTFTLTVGEAAATPPDTGSASGSMSNFHKTRTYTPGMFPDVVESMWYGYEKEKSVANAYEYNLMSGYPDGTFRPAGNMTLAEAITIAARVRNIYNGGTGEFTQGSVWYQVYVDYAVANDIISANDFNNYNSAATRAQMAYIFSRSLPAGEFGAINTVNTLPDVNSGTPYYNAILMMYKAGVVGGDEGTNAFRPGDNVSRAEAAAIITRVILPSSRLSGRTYG